MQVDQIPSGYKLTEVGIIPSDWDVVKLPEICWFQEGPGLRNWQFTNRGIKIINVTNLENGYLNLDKTDRYISLKEFNKMYQHFSIDDQDIVMASSGNSYSKVATVRKKDLPLLMNTSVIRFKPLKDINYKYLLMFLNSYVFKEQIDILITGGAQPNFGPVHLKKIHVPLPPIEEQKRIAQVLSDIDELIRSLDELIIKKRNIKQGTMQLLLTGKQRLPGYSGEWEVKTFDDCFKFLTTGSNARSDLSESGEVKYIHYGDIHAKKLPILDCAKDFIPGIARNKVKNLPLLEDGDLIIADASEDYQGLGKSIEIKNVNNCEIVAGLHTLLLRADKLVLADGFKAYITSIESVKNALIKIATGISVFGISKKAIKSIQLFLPPLEEQKAIARILSDMDEEIEVLEQKRNKYQDIKKGMMQELLTGKTRLV